MGVLEQPEGHFSGGRDEPVHRLRQEPHDQVYAVNYHVLSLSRAYTSQGLFISLHFFRISLESGGAVPPLRRIRLALPPHLHVSRRERRIALFWRHCRANLDTFESRLVGFLDNARGKRHERLGEG